MSADSVLSADADGAESGRDAGDTCRAPNCWRDGHTVRVAGQTVRVAVLCDRHRRAFLEVSS